MMGPMKRFSLDARTWLLLGALASAALLAGAHAFETFGHYSPCELCYKQRDVHWLALWVGALGFGVSFWRPGVARLACLLLALVFLGSAVLGAYHAGVEWKWWPGPTTCSGAHDKTVDVAALMRLVNGGGDHIVACDQAAWRMFGISMAGYNALISLVLAGLSALFAYRDGRRG
jgi:disulfide bond formation protein DsbB